MNKKAVFDRSSFRLCQIPVPKGYPQSQTHCGVVFVDGICYMTTSPYPAKVINIWYARLKRLINILSFGYLCNPLRAEAFENPCIYMGANSNNNPPIQFELMSEKPLMDTPEDYYGLPSYNSDPDIFYEDGKFYILNRSVLRTKIYPDHRPYDSKTRIYLISGEREGNKFKMISNTLIREWEKPYASPCLTKYNGKYLFTYIDTNSANDGQTFNGIYYSLSDNIDTLKSNAELKETIIKGVDLLPWHMSLFQYNEKLYTIISCVEKGRKTHIWQMLGEYSDDLSELFIYSTPLTDYNSYRGSACIADNDNLVLYTPTVHEKVKGSRSVDGRDILMVETSFMELLTRLKSNETEI